MTQTYGKPPVDCGHFPDVNLNEVMYYLYLPIYMSDRMGPVSRVAICLPANVRGLLPLVWEACRHEQPRNWKYIYLSARKGWATPDNPLNRPGWHCDGFGSPDMNYIWWSGPGTRFLVDPEHGIPDLISENHIRSMHQFEGWADEAPDKIVTDMPARHLYQLDRYVIHATPELTEGCMRQFVKISFSNERYNLYGNSHNYLFDYDWPMVDRETVRNDTSKAQGDHA